MNLSRLRAFTKTKVFLVIMISLTCLGHDCSSDPSITKNLSDTSILQGRNHTFECEGTGPNTIEWTINGVSVWDWPPDSRLEPVALKHTHGHAGDVCIRGSKMTLLAKGAPEDNTSSTFLVRCGIAQFPIFVSSEAYLKLHVIGKAGDVQLIPPANPQGSAMMQWQAPDVLSGSSSPLYYNITVTSSTQVIAQNTTTDTFFAIDNDQLVPCTSYQLNILPFQQISGRTELGIMTQTSINYSGIPLPATGVNFSVSMQSSSALVTIRFQAQLTSCSLQQPKKFTATVNRQGTNADETVLSVQQKVVGVVNEYILGKELDLRQKYQLSLILENNLSSSAPKIASFSTFDVQNLTLNIQGGSHKLNVTCQMAKGAEDKECTVEMTNETGAMQLNCNRTSGRNAACTLQGFPRGRYMVLGYDQEYKENPAVKREFLVTEELIDPTNTMPTTWTDDATTIQSSPDRFEDEAVVQTEIVVGILASVILVIAVSVVIFVIIVVLHRKTRKRGPDPPERQEHFYPTVKENLYGHSFPWQLNAIDASAVVTEPVYDQTQAVISTTAPANNSSIQYMQRRDEWLVGPSHSDEPALPPSHSEPTTLPHTHNVDRAPQDTNL